jgi:hypothetical protein
MEILQLLCSCYYCLANIPQLKSQLNYSAICSQSPLQNSTQLNWPGYNFSARTTQKHLCVHIRLCGNMFTELLPRNGFITNTLPQQWASFSDCHPATGLHATISQNRWHKLCFKFKLVKGSARIKGNTQMGMQVFCIILLVCSPFRN